MTIIAVEDLLVTMSREVRSKGSPAHLVRFDYGTPETDDSKTALAEFSDAEFSELRVALKEAMAIGHIKYASMNGGHVVLTQRGFNAGLSRDRFVQQQAERGWFKRISDWVNEHNGISTLYAVVISTAALLVAGFQAYVAWTKS